MDSDQDQDQEEEVIEHEIEPSSLQISPDTVKLDIFQHLRSGVNNKDLNCFCENDLEKLFYCIPCKVSCCTKCTLEEHSSHLLIQKDKYSLKSPQIEKSFASIENMLEKVDLFQNLQQKRKELINEINITCQKIETLVKEW